MYINNQYVYTLLCHSMKFKYIQDIVICEQKMAMNRTEEQQVKRWSDRE